MYSPAQTITEEAWVRACFVKEFGQPFLIGPVCVRIEVFVAFPAGGTAKRRAAIERGEIFPLGKPDLDNIAKLHLDALNGILFRDDSQVVELTVLKRWGPVPQAVFSWREGG
jgi:Holliday junction resolvase RusA-like endonuclease